jgi:hypothetical protein
MEFVNINFNFSFKQEIAFAVSLLNEEAPGHSLNLLKGHVPQISLLLRKSATAFQRVHGERTCLLVLVSF